MIGRKDTAMTREMVSINLFRVIHRAGFACGFVSWFSKPLEGYCTAGHAGHAAKKR
jgi:hypothetical protein